MSVLLVWHLPLNVAVVLVVAVAVAVAVASAVNGQTKFAVKKLMQHLDKVREQQKHKYGKIYKISKANLQGVE